MPTSDYDRRVGEELLVIAGPTASGKTAVALALARRLGAEIVSADSQQVYRHFDIGTAKPSPEELAAVPHHLISVVEPTELFSAGRFQQLADVAISEIQARGKRVVIAGGTGLYLRVLLHGVVDAPPRDEELRARLEDEARSHGVAALYARLSQVDPDAAAKIAPVDLVRIIRALEILALTGETASQRRAKHGFSSARHPFRMFVLNPDRAELYAAINERTRRMFEHGLLDEVRSLIARGFRHAAPMRSVGYSEAIEIVEGRLTVEEGIARAAQATRNYAKRQLTWFRKEAGAEFIGPPYVDTVAAAIRN